MESRCCYLVFDLVLLGILKRNVVFGKTSLALSVLQQNESDLRTRKGENNLQKRNRKFGMKAIMIMRNYHLRRWIRVAERGELWNVSELLRSMWSARDEEDDHSNDFTLKLSLLFIYFYYFYFVIAMQLACNDADERDKGFAHTSLSFKFQRSN